MKNQRKRFFAREFMPGKWRVYDRNQSETVPVYDDAPHGNDKPLVFTEDSAIDFVATMNNNTNEN